MAIVFLENIFLPQVSLRIDWTPKNPFLNMNRNWENSFFSIALSGSIFQKFGKKASSRIRKPAKQIKPFAGSGYKLIDRRCLTKKIHEIADMGSKKLFQLPRAFPGVLICIQLFIYRHTPPKGRGRRPLCRPSPRCRPQGLRVIALS